MKSWQHLSFVLVIYLFQTAYTARISQTGNAVVNGPVTIECVFDSVAGSIQITDPAGNLAANCLVPTGTTSTCLPVTDPNYSSSQDVTTKTTSVTIAVTARATHEGTWTCTKTGDPPITTFLIILAIPTLNVAQTVSALTLSSSNTQTLTIAATCAYPAVSLVLYFVPTGGGTAVRSPSSTSSCTNSSSACADTDAQDYTCDIVPKLEASLSAGTYNMLVVVNLAGQYESIGLNATITDTVITVIEPTTTTPTREPTTTTPTPAPETTSVPTTVPTLTTDSSGVEPTSTNTFTASTNKASLSPSRAAPVSTTTQKPVGSSDWQTPVIAGSVAAVVVVVVVVIVVLCKRKSKPAHNSGSHSTEWRVSDKIDARVRGAHINSAFDNSDLTDIDEKRLHSSFQDPRKSSNEISNRSSISESRFLQGTSTPQNPSSSDYGADLTKETFSSKPGMTIPRPEVQMSRNSMKDQFWEEKL